MVDEEYSIAILLIVVCRHDLTTNYGGKLVNSAEMTANIP